MKNGSALRGMSACSASASARSRDEPESVRLEESPCTPTRPCVQQLPLALAGTGNTSRSVDLASKVVAGFVHRDVERLLGSSAFSDWTRLGNGRWQECRPCDVNSVCRGSIVSCARRTLTAFGVPAGILAAGPVTPSYSSCWTRERSCERHDQRIWDSASAPAACSVGSSVATRPRPRRIGMAGKSKKHGVATLFPWEPGRRSRCKA